MSYEEYIKAELLILVPTLYVLGMYLKKTGWVKDNHIPFLLGIIGIILAALYVASTEGISAASIFSSIVQGILTSGAAVYTNQLIKQLEKDEL